MNSLNYFYQLRSLILQIKEDPIFSLINQYKKYKNLLKKNPKGLLQLVNKFIKEQIRTQKKKIIYNFLAKLKSYQFDNYELLKGKFSGIYNNLIKFDIKHFITPLWEEYNRRIKTAILPFPLFSFLNHPVIRETMFLTSHVKWLKTEIKFIEKKYNTKLLRSLLLEDFIGMPEISNLKYKTSNTTIHHFYSISKFIDISKCTFNDIDTIIEWGGGYGNMAKILLRMIKKKITYIIMDTPTFSCIQWLYLSSIFGIGNVNLIENLNDKIEPNKINLLPICFIDQYKLDTDLFISTWALNESSKNSQNFVVKNNWFNARHFLLAYEQSNELYPSSHRLNKFAVNLGLKIEEIEHLTDSRYAIK